MTNLDVLEQLELSRVPRWIGANAAKEPICAFNSQRHASTTNERTWSTFDVARRGLERGLFPNIGFVFTKTPYVGVDLDKCRNPETRIIEPRAQEIIDLFDSYTDESVSGRGVHIICRGILPGDKRRSGRIEMYDQSSPRHFVMTGRVIRDSKIEERSSQLATLYQQTFGVTPLPAYIDRADAALQLDVLPDERRFEPLTDDEVLLRAATAGNGEKFLRLWRGDLSDHEHDHSVADLALVSILLYWTQGDREQADRLFRQSNLVRPKWTNRADYRARTFAKAMSS